MGASGPDAVAVVAEAAAVGWVVGVLAGVEQFAACVWVVVGVGGWLVAAAGSVAVLLVAGANGVAVEDCSAEALLVAVVVATCGGVGAALVEDGVVALVAVLALAVPGGEAVTA